MSEETVPPEAEQLPQPVQANEPEIAPQPEGEGAVLAPMPKAEQPEEAAQVEAEAQADASAPDEFKLTHPAALAAKAFELLAKSGNINPIVSRELYAIATEFKAWEKIDAESHT